MLCIHLLSIDLLMEDIDLSLKASRLHLMLI